MAEKSGDLFRYNCKVCLKAFLSNKKNEAKTRRDDHQETCKAKPK